MPLPLVPMPWADPEGTARTRSVVHQKSPVPVRRDRASPESLCPVLVMGHMPWTIIAVLLVVSVVVRARGGCGCRDQTLLDPDAAVTILSRAAVAVKNP